MLDLKLLRREPDRVRTALARRGAAGAVDELHKHDGRRREILPELEGLRAQRNEASEAIGQAKRSGEDASEAIAQMREVGSQIKDLEGELALVDVATLSCAPNVAGVSLPTANVALNGARARDVLFTTPQNILDLGNRLQYSRVLPPNMTQLDAMEAQNPKLVSVELGSNEVLSAQSGVALVGAPPLPVENPATFASQYHQILDRIESAGVKHVLLVGLPTNLFSVPAFRSGAEIAANAALLFVAFNVAVQPDCGTTAAQNQIYVTIKLSTAIRDGLAAKALGQPPVSFSCAGSGPTTVDFVLNQAEQAIIGAVVAQMNAVIQGEAQARGFAFMSLDALYSAPGVRTPLNAVALFTTAQPFGPFMSLDGLHPNAAGQALLAAAAAEALNAKYDLGIPTP